MGTSLSIIKCFKMFIWTLWEVKTSENSWWISEKVRFYPKSGSKKLKKNRKFWWSEFRWKTFAFAWKLLQPLSCCMIVPKIDIIFPVTVKKCQKYVIFSSFSRKCPKRVLFEGFSTWNPKKSSFFQFLWTQISSCCLFRSNF